MKIPGEITIARVIARLNVGGPSIQAVLMTAAFSRKGYQALLLTGTVPAEEASMEYLADAYGVRPTRIPTLSRGISGVKDLAALWRLVATFRREKPLVVHTHTAKAGTLGRLAALATRVPVVVHTFHGHVFDGYFSPFATRVFLGIERFLARYTDRIIAVSESQKRELVDVYRVAQDEKVSVIPLGFDMDPYLRVAGRDNTLRGLLDCSAGTTLVGWVGRLTPIKAPELFLACADRLRSRAPDLRFAVIGDGELRDQCEQFVATAQLDPIVTFTGSQQQLERIYADLDLLVLTSINEGTPVALLEAMASSRAFVATDVGGVRDLMVGTPQEKSGFEVFENGILVPRDPEILASAVTYLTEKAELRRRMGEAGRRFVAGRFSEQRLAGDLEALYLAIARSKKVADAPHAVSQAA
jgi:glycosyltransferase involved in cell wall biosynthesis